MLSENNLLRQFAQVGSLGFLLLLAACDSQQITKDVGPEPVTGSAVESQVVADALPAAPATEVTRVEPKEPYNIHFTIGSARLSPDATEALTSAVDYLRDNPTARVFLSGYTDLLGSAAANKKLAERRVASAVEYLEEHGVDPSRITTMAVGETEGALTPEGEDSAAWNRRVHVEFAVVPNS